MVDKKEMITHFKTYGKLPIYKKVVLTIKDRFVINPYANNLLIERELKPYIPKLNKLQFSLGLVGALFCVVMPFITPLCLIPLLWGIK